MRTILFALFFLVFGCENAEKEISYPQEVLYDNLKEEYLFAKWVLFEFYFQCLIDQDYIFQRDFIKEDFRFQYIRYTQSGEIVFNFKLVDSVEKLINTEPNCSYYHSIFFKNGKVTYIEMDDGVRFDARSFHLDYDNYYSEYTPFFKSHKFYLNDFLKAEAIKRGAIEFPNASK